MWVIAKWHILPYIKGVISYNTIHKSREYLKYGKEKFSKNKSIIIIT